MQADASQTGAGATPSTAYRHYVVWLLFLIAIVNFFDRQIVNILAESIKHDLGLADWQLGLLTGLSFAALYTIAGIPVALIADRTNRALVISGSLTVWSVFTALCGLAQNYTQLLIARLGVGLGEAGCQPPSHSLITDYAPKEKRASMLSIYSLGIPAGSLAALTIGGVMADTLGWRQAFFIAGVPGLVLALIAFLTLKDPRAGKPKAERTSTPVARTFAEIRRSPAFWWLSLGAACMALISYGQLAFFGSFFLRVHGAGLKDVSASLATVGIQLGPTGLVGMGLGVIVGVAGILGAWLGGRLGDHFSKQDKGALLWLPAVAAPVCVPFYVAAFLVPSAGWALLLLFVPKLVAGLWFGPTFAAMQSVVSPGSRATASAVHSSVVLFIGLGFGPVLVGAASDWFAGPMGFGPAQGVRWALVVTSFTSLLAMVFFWIASRKLRSAELS